MRGAVRAQLLDVPPHPIKAIGYSMSPHPLLDGASFEAGHEDALRELAKWFANGAALVALGLVTTLAVPRLRKL